MICQKCGNIPQCRQCDVSVAYHKLENGEFIGMCHICKIQYQPVHECPECNHSELRMYGLGIQQASLMIKDMFGIEPYIIESRSVNSLKKIVRNIQDARKSQIIIGTELLTTPIDGINFDLLVYLDADVGLNIPDFAAAKRNFHFLYDGLHNHQCKQFVVQSYKVEHYSIRAACALDPIRFAKADDEFRNEHAYPPYGDVCVLRYKHEVEERLHNQVASLHKELMFLQQKYKMDTLEIYTTPPLVYRIYGKYRYHVILKGRKLREFMDVVYSKLNLQKRGFKVDWDARSLV